MIRIERKANKIRFSLKVSKGKWLIMTIGFWRPNKLYFVHLCFSYVHHHKIRFVNNAVKSKSSPHAFNLIISCLFFWIAILSSQDQASITQKEDETFYTSLGWLDLPPPSLHSFLLLSSKEKDKRAQDKSTHKSIKMTREMLLLRETVKENSEISFCCLLGLSRESRDVFFVCGFFRPVKSSH